MALPCSNIDTCLYKSDDTNMSAIVDYFTQIYKKTLFLG